MFRERGDRRLLMNQEEKRGNPVDGTIETRRDERPRWTLVVWMDVVLSGFRRQRNAGLSRLLAVCTSCWMAVEGCLGQLGSWSIMGAEPLDNSK